MKVVLLREVPKLGRKHEVKDVSDGYAANFLFPRKLAEPATPQLLKEIASLNLKKEEEQKTNAALFAKHLATLRDKPVTIYAKGNEQGHLFAGVRKETILEAIWELANIRLPEEFLELDKPIRVAGISKLPVEGYGQKGVVTVEVKTK